MSRVTDRLTEDDLRELARLVRVIHADAAAWREREEAQHSEAGRKAAAEQDEAGP
jgi:hypothetical protein